MQNFSRAKLRAATPQPLLAGAFVAIPRAPSALAATFPWEGPLNMRAEILRGTNASLVAIIVVAAMGFAAFPRFMPMGWVLSMIGGIVLIFDSAAVADLVIGSTGS